MNPSRQSAVSGSLSLETAIIGAGMVVFLGLCFAAGRLAIADNAVEEAARNAARQASIARTASAARANALDAAQTTLAAQHLKCAGVTVDLDLDGFDVPVGSPASVAATVICPVRLGDLGVPGMPVTRTLAARFTSPLDTYRARS
jgi:Flp pilus assembly protein TadG